MSDSNKFEQPTFQTYLGWCLWLPWFFLINYIDIYTYFMSPLEFHDFFSNWSVTGSAAQKRAGALIIFTYKYFGRNGILVLGTTMTLIVDLETIGSFLKLVRYHRKNRLYKRGLVTNLDDDYEFPRLSVLIKNLFTKDKSKRRRIAFRSKKEYREMRKKFEKDALYKKMYPS